MTVVQLASQLTVEELAGWAAYYDLKNEKEERAATQARTANKVRSMTKR